MKDISIMSAENVTRNLKLNRAAGYIPSFFTNQLTNLSREALNKLFLKTKSFEAGYNNKM